MTTETIVGRMSVESNKNALVSDLKTVVGDADRLISNVASSTAEEFANARTKLEAKLSEARSNLHDVRIAAADQAKHVVEVTHKYVIDNPWKALGAMAAAGLLIGILSSRRSSARSDSRA